MKEILPTGGYLQRCLPGIQRRPTRVSGNFGEV